jgi:hypothetical protein
MNFEELIGKTIINVQQKKLSGYTDAGFLMLYFSDGTEALIVGGCTGYDPDSEDGEYATTIFLNDKNRYGLVDYFEEEEPYPPQ